MMVNIVAPEGSRCSECGEENCPCDINDIEDDLTTKTFSMKSLALGLVFLGIFMAVMGGTMMVTDNSAEIACIVVGLTLIVVSLMLLVALHSSAPASQQSQPQSYDDLESPKEVACLNDLPPDYYTVVPPIDTNQDEINCSHSQAASVQSQTAPPLQSQTADIQSQTATSPVATITQCGSALLQDHGDRENMHCSNMDIAPVHEQNLSLLSDCNAIDNEQPPPYQDVCHITLTSLSSRV